MLWWLLAWGCEWGKEIKGEGGSSSHPIFKLQIIQYVTQRTCSKIAVLDAEYMVIRSMIVFNLSLFCFRGVSRFFFQKNPTTKPTNVWIEEGGSAFPSGERRSLETGVFPLLFPPHPSLKGTMISSEEMNLDLLLWICSVHHSTCAAGVSQEWHRQSILRYSEKCLFPQPGRERED